MTLKPPQNIAIAGRIANQSWQLIKPHFDLQFSRISETTPHSISSGVSVNKQSIGNLIVKILPDLLSNPNLYRTEANSRTQINQVLLNYKFANLKSTKALKSVYIADKIIKYLPLISKLPSLQFPLFQPSEEGPLLQPSIIIASFQFPNAPISSEYFKYFELLQRANLSTPKRSQKKKRTLPKQKRS